MSILIVATRTPKQRVYYITLFGLPGSDTELEPNIVVFYRVYREHEGSV